MPPEHKGFESESPTSVENTLTTGAVGKRWAHLLVVCVKLDKLKVGLSYQATEARYWRTRCLM